MRGAAAHGGGAGRLKAKAKGLAEGITIIPDDKRNNRPSDTYLKEYDSIIKKLKALRPDLKDDLPPELIAADASYCELYGHLKQLAALL